MLIKLLTYSFYLLFFLTPLLWSSLNYELFEYNKMMFVYALTIIICGGWLLRILNERTIFFKRTPLDIPLLLFLLANILSTIFSIDKHISLWGYYSRSNGGLISTISYILLFYALISNFDKEQVVKFLKVGVWGGIAVALYAIPEHFGVSPSCIILHGTLSANCWVQDVQARVFATLGQPNWLAAYLGMLIFPAFYLYLTEKLPLQKIFYFSTVIIFYLAFTFTYSRGATLGLIGGLGVFLAGVFVIFKQSKASLNIKHVSMVLAGFLLINLIFASSLTSFKLFSKFAPPPRPTLSIPTSAPAPSGTVLENGGTESGQIRLIVWKGALEIFKHYPIFGSGVETFAYAYYQFRPVEHNLVSEWDFLYNKAHNEFLNYLATTGSVGFISYLGVIVIFIIWSIKNIFIVFKQKGLEPNYHLLTTAVLASYISYLIQNFFLFSVVSTALFFYLFPAIVFVVHQENKPLDSNSLLNKLEQRRILSFLSKAIVVTLMIILSAKLIMFYVADTIFSSGYKASEAGTVTTSYNLISQALTLNPNEPFYKSELAYAAAGASTLYAGTDATKSAKLKDQAVLYTNQVLAQSPSNTSFYRTAIRTHFLISTIDKSFSQKTIDTLDQTIRLAPTDAKLWYNKGIIHGQAGQNQDAIKSLEQAVRLKPNYREARYSLGVFYFENKQRPEAIDQMQQVLRLIPGDPEALEKLRQWEK